MEDKKDREGFPEKAREHFDGFMKSIENYPKESRDKYWWAWTSQFGDELKEAQERSLLTDEEIRDIKKRVRDFLDKEGNKDGFEEAMEFFGENEVEIDRWWEEEK